MCVCVLGSQSGCLPEWHRITLDHRLESSAYTSVPDTRLVLCLRTCDDDDTCVAVDHNHDTLECRLHAKRCKNC